MDQQLIANKAKFLPDKPGVYLFRDECGKVLYVGKAVSLKNRVRSYFTGAQNDKIQLMLSKAADVDFIATHSEVEALILESNLIKEHHPQYNVLLKDDKSYPYLKITLQEDYPRVFLTRYRKNDGGRYFGPYPSAGAVHETLRLLKKLFPLRTCRRMSTVQSRACLNYDIGRCLAPCLGKITPAQYHKIVEEVLLFLEGRHKELIRMLNQKMKKAAAELNYERAAELRDQLQAIEQVLSRQNIVSQKRESMDVMALARVKNKGRMVVLEIREGKLLGQHNLPLQGIGAIEEEEIFAAFLKQYYQEGRKVPPEILVPSLALKEKELISNWLEMCRRGRVKLHFPRRGRKKELLKMALENASFIQEQMMMERNKDAALSELAGKLALENQPVRLEGYDVSHLQSSQTVGVMVVFENGRPVPAEYRRFKLDEFGKPDDYAAIREVLRRRFQRGLEERKLIDQGVLSSKKAGFARWPDLVLIDGGKGQLNAALAGMQAAGCVDVPVFSIAKENEEVFGLKQKGPLRIDRDSLALYLLQHLRDEAHRFAVEYHRQSHHKASLRSVIDEIEGIGPVRRRALQRAFSTLEALKRASVDELTAVAGMNKRAAKAVYDYFKGRE